MSNNNIPGDVLAAISMAIFDLQDEVHDVEAKVITIKRKPQDYQPWCDKSFGMLQTPIRK
ncbi:hypothetical protein D0T53_09845 [Dysgonomonas sp. 216]|uniref:hypothetical protein n=1 Tax=Dysgonomonas sp. 216 TaxID=2302934 RepID=UPI0013D4F064|nr:hypothetical protein [Dysgonomonas sp. 216]NDW19213.1 hypothetical protein [Dysgonomonas sp. 216]